jgi:hypothetical protein
MLESDRIAVVYVADRNSGDVRIEFRRGPPDRAFGISLEAKVHEMHLVSGCIESRRDAREPVRNDRIGLPLAVGANQ